MKRRQYFNVLVIVLIFLLPVIVFADVGDIGGVSAQVSERDPATEFIATNPSPCIANPSCQSQLSADQINSLSFINLQRLTNPDAIRRVSSENIEHLTGSQISEVGPETLTDSQLKGLTSQQLLSGNNFDRVPDKSKLGSNALNQVLTQRAGTGVQLDTKGRATAGKLLPTGFEFASVPFLQVQTIKVSNGEDVRYENGRLKAKRADELEYKGAQSRKVYSLEADEVKLHVGSAEEVNAGCFQTTNVSSANFVVNQSQIMLNGGSATVVYGDSSGFEYSSTANNSFMTANPAACVSTNYSQRGQSYEVAAATIRFSSKVSDETVNINSTGFLNASPEFGVYCVFLSPNSRYDFGLDEKTFSILSTGFHQVCVRRHQAQFFSRDCSSCSVVDLLAKELLTKGDMSYLQNAPVNTPVFTSKNLDGSAVLDFSDAYTGVQIETDAPEYVTRINEMAQIVEKNVGSETHQFLNISNVAAVTGLVSNYSVFYDDAYLYTKNGIINYTTSDGFEVVVLPPSSAGLFGIALAFGLFRKRKSQIALYFLIGLIFVIAVSFALLSLEGTKNRNMVLTDKLQVQNYLTSCLENAADDALVNYGKESYSDAAAKLSQKTASFFVDCAKEMRVSGTTAFGTPNVDVLIADEEVIFSAKFPVVIKNKETITLDEFQANRKVRLKRLLEIADVLAKSSKSTGMFDITEARTPDVSIVFWTDENKIYSKITDRNARIKNGVFELVSQFHLNTPTVPNV